MHVFQSSWVLMPHPSTRDYGISWVLICVRISWNSYPSIFRLLTYDPQYFITNKFIKTIYIFFLPIFYLKVAIDVEFARNTLNNFKKVNPTVSIVGWFATGNDIPNTSCLIHEYYSRETRSPIHLTIDTTLKNNRPEVKAYCSMEIGVPERKQGTIFVPIPIEVISYDAERLASNLFLATNKRLIVWNKVYKCYFL